MSTKLGTPSETRDDLVSSRNGRSFASTWGRLSWLYAGSVSFPAGGGVGSLATFPSVVEEDFSNREAVSAAINQRCPRWIWFGFSTFCDCALPAPLQKHTRQIGAHLLPLLKYELLKFA